jgi:prepilin-type N-terminal cleavage/methylation domain-containing protein
MLRRRPTAPPGFTLVELLVVITIIGILLGLLLPAIQSARQAARRMQAKSEISQLATAADSFKNDWGAYPPTHFQLPTYPGTNVSSGLVASGNYLLGQPNAALQDESFSFLKKKFARWQPVLTGTGQIDWTVYPGMIQYFNATAQGNNLTLVGNQSMTFFLAGPANTGWAKDQPATPSATAATKDFYLQVDGSKFKAGDATIDGVPNGYANAAPVYMDPYGVPYQYFGSHKTGGKYAGQVVVINTVNYYPLQDRSGKFANEWGCQIISAGENGPRDTAPKGFGNTAPLVVPPATGGNWIPEIGQYAEGKPGWDDMANFNGDLRLGVKQ